MSTAEGKMVVKRPSGKNGIKVERIEQEMRWRVWFPQSVVWPQWDGARPKRVTDPEVAEAMLAGFEQFCRDNLKIKFPGKGMIPLELRDAQRETVLGWLSHRQTIVLKARQIGFSTVSAAFALWLTLGWPDREIIMLSKGEREARKLLGKARYAYRKMPDWVRERGPKLTSRSLETMSFDNDSLIQSLPSASDPGRGESVFLVFVDEWAMLNNQEEAWSAIEPIANIGGRVIGLSTAKGEGSFFHRLWEGSSAGTGSKKNMFHGMFFPWWSVPDRDEEWYEEQAANMEPHMLYQEYPSTPEEAFIGSGNPFFNVEFIRQMEPRNPEWVGEIELNPGTRHHVLSAGKSFQVWKQPELDRAYVIGADVAMGLEHGDFSCAWVMDAADSEVVAVWHGKIDPDEFGFKTLAAIGYMYNTALICPEVNNHGVATVKALQRVKYPRIYRRRTRLKRQEAVTETVGWMTTISSKRDLMDNLAAWIRDGHNCPHARTIHELMTFVREQKGPDHVKLHGSPYDDCVMALGMAVEAQKYAVVHGFTKGKPEMVAGSIAWWAQKLSGGSNPKQKVRAGL